MEVHTLDEPAPTVMTGNEAGAVENGKLGTEGNDVTKFGQMQTEYDCDDSASVTSVPASVTSVPGSNASLQSQPVGGIFGRLKSMALQSSFVNGAMSRLTLEERQQRMLAEAQRDEAVKEKKDAVAAAASLRYERDEARAMAVGLLVAIIFTGSISRWTLWCAALVASFFVRVAKPPADFILASAAAGPPPSRSTPPPSPRTPAAKEEPGSDLPATAEIKEDDGAKIVSDRKPEIPMPKNAVQRTEEVRRFLRNYFPAFIITCVAVLLLDSFATRDTKNVLSSSSAWNSNESFDTPMKILPPTYAESGLRTKKEAQPVHPAAPAAGNPQQQSPEVSAAATAAVDVLKEKSQDNSASAVAAATAEQSEECTTAEEQSEKCAATRNKTKATPAANHSLPVRSSGGEH